MLQRKTVSSVTVSFVTNHGLFLKAVGSPYSDLTEEVATPLAETLWNRMGSRAAGHGIGVAGKEKPPVLMPEARIVRVLEG